MKYFSKIIKKLISKKISISVAESCTGGLLSSKFTSFSNISKVFNVGLIVYSNKAKIKILNIPKNLIKINGAVSEEVAKEMLNQLYRKTKSKLCISTTGIAGPSGGTKKKPVGLVYFGIKFKKKNIIIQKKYNGNRKSIQNKTVNDIFKEIDTLI